KVGGKRVYILLSKADDDSRFPTACLHSSTARNNDDEFAPKIGEDVSAGPPESIAIREQHDHRCDAPCHAEHGQGGATAIVPHRGVGFVEQIIEHRITPVGEPPPAAAWQLCVRGRGPRSHRLGSGCRSPAWPTLEPTWVDRILPAPGSFPSSP